METPVTGITRRCARCRETKDLSEFGINRAKKHGRQHRCRPCMRRIDRERRADPEKLARERALERAARGKPDRKERAAASHKAYYQQHGDRYRQRARERHNRCWSERLLYSAQAASRQRIARGRNCPITITKAHIETMWEQQGGICYFTGIEMSQANNRLDTVSIDRLDPAKGYDPGNVVLATKAANFAKTGHSEEEFRDFLDRIADSIVARRRIKSVA